jgi:hypothetical protein
MNDAIRAREATSVVASAVARADQARRRAPALRIVLI